MNVILNRLSRLITARPYVTLLALIVLTVALGAGGMLRAPQPEVSDILPKDSAVAQALEEINELFGESGETSGITLVFRGAAMTPEGLSEMDALLGEIIGEPEVAKLRAPDHPLVAPSELLKAALQVEGFASVTQEQIDFIRSVPEVGAALNAMTGTDTDGTQVAVASLRLLNTGDGRTLDVQRKADAIAVGHQGALRVSTVSFATIEDESRRGTEEDMLPLVGLAFLLIAGLILLFMRTISDLLLTVVGLFMAVVWTIGIEGWLGPNGLRLVGPPNTLTVMVPIIIIGLTVDYAIQSVSHYREQRAAGEPVLASVRTGLRNVMVPLVLAAVTTIVSLLANLFSPVDIVGDFGVIAGLGVGMSLLVMLTLLPAVRTILDRRREARGTLRPPRPISGALPGVERVAEWLGRQVTRHPAPYLLAVAAITVALGFAARDLESDFSIRDLLPRDGNVARDLDTLDATVGGSTESVNVLLKAEATDTRTLLNLRGLAAAFQDEQRRPQVVAGPATNSYELLVRDWTTDSGEPGDKYDPELAALLREASGGIEVDRGLMQELLDKIGERDPALSRMLVNNPDGMDTILLQFPAYLSDRDENRLVQTYLEDLWQGDDTALTATSVSIVSIAVTDSITEAQTQAITITILSALVVLAVFFWLTVRQPALAFIAVAPIVLVLIMVLGTMALLGIPYTLVTSIITALSIGIGVDYTIHMIHRYREEYARNREPEQAAVRTLSTTGSALLGSALTTALGLGVLALSPMAAFQQFGFTAAITIAFSLIVSILVVPPAMTVWGAYQNMRLRSTVRRWEHEMDMEIEAVYRRMEEEAAS